MPQQTTRSPHRSPQIVIIGSGFAGVGMGIQLKLAGMHDFVILESAAAVGGTWRDNTYPGAACDVPSHLYSFSFEPWPWWSHAFAHQDEILRYMQHCVDRYDLQPHVRLNSAVTAATFDEKSNRWQVTLAGGETLDCWLLISGTGGLSRPANPDIPGLDQFRGPIFHTARWHHEVNLAGKRVAVIGTGASAIQVVPELAKTAAQLHLFQRTPPWILPKPDREIGPREQRLYARLPWLQWLNRARIYLLLEWRAIAFTRFTGIMKLPRMGALRFIRKSIANPELRAKVTPDYAFGCKRVLISNNYYPALNRDNVQLVAGGAKALTADAVVGADGQSWPVDAVVLATGFQASESMAPFPINGLHGQSLDSAWAGGAEAFKGTTVAGFPNLFLIVGPNTGLGHNSMVYIIESQIRYIMDAIQTLQTQQLAWVAPKPATQDQYNRQLHQRLGKSVWASGCKSWYQTASGKNTTLWPGFTFSFRHQLSRFELSDYEWQASQPAENQLAASAQVKAVLS